MTAVYMRFWILQTTTRSLRLWTTRRCSSAIRQSASVRGVD
nr:MAG TPA: hypothetical protein [Caudoviricetes sp.]